jgi:glycosyltransferase involved in cell wall biosynthesis
MKILYLHQYFVTPDRPGCTRSFEMARRLVDAGHEVQLLTSYREEDGAAGRDWFETEESGVRVHWLPVPYSNRMSNQERIRAFLRFAWGVGRRAAQLDGDVVFATSTPLTIALPAVYAARRRRIPMVFEVRDLWPELPIAVGALRDPVSIGAARWLERFAYRNARHVVALSPEMKAGIVRTGYPSERVTVIPNSCDLDMFDIPAEHGRELRRRHEWLRDRPLVLYAGTFGPINGVDYLARLAAEVYAIDPEVRFVVMGSGKEEEKVRAAARDCGVLDRSFFMLPPVPKRDMPAWFSAANVSTSLFIDLKEMWANSANKFFDGLAAGRPVAINYGGWQAAVLEEAEAGLVLDPRDVAQAARTLARAVRDDAWLARAGAAARRLAVHRFSRDALAVQLEKVLRDSAGVGVRRDPLVGQLSTAS